MTYHYAKSYQPPQPSVPVVPGDLHDFSLGDAYVISQPIPRPEELPVDVLEGGLSWTGVMRAIEKGPQSHAEGRNPDGRVPVRYVVLVFVGLLLTGLGLVGWWLSPLLLEVTKR